MKRALVLVVGMVAAACAQPGSDPHAADLDASATDAGPNDGENAFDANPTDAADTDIDTDADTDASVTPDAATFVCGFDAPATSWTMPHDAGPNGFGAFEGVNAVGNFKTIDLDGDHRPDLVDLADFADTAIGATHWRRHAGGAGGFATSGSIWSLPTTGGPFRYLNSDTAPTFDLVDMNGDARPELVVTYRGAAAPTVGTERWDVYHNDGHGFAASGTPWALPPGYAQNTFRRARTSVLPCPDSPVYELFDIDGDERPDLVVTDACEGTPSTRWSVYRNNGAGFDASPTTWQLRFPENYDLCDVPRLVRFGHVDLDGDRRPDLVVTASCTSDEVGSTHWLVHRNLGDSFASLAQPWSLPGGQRFERLLSTTVPSFTTTDIDGDGRPELVVLSRTGTNIGTARWLVHHNTGTGFAQPADWCLPSGYGTAAFAVAPHDACRVFQDTPAWSLLDLDADGARELVIANDNCDSTSAAGTDHWFVHRR